MNVSMNRLPYFFLVALIPNLFSSYDIIPDTWSAFGGKPDTLILPNQPLYIGDLKIRGVNFPGAFGILLTFEQSLSQPLHDSILG